jgi:hypothetical protein
MGAVTCAEVRRRSCRYCGLNWSQWRLHGWRWIEALLKDSPDVLAMWEKEMQVGQGHRSDLVDNINEVSTKKGTSKAYTVSRLKRESPELFAQVVAGELSANAAAIKAGWRKVKRKERRI